MIQEIILKRSFYERDTRVVAAELIGKILVFCDGGNEFRGKIVETEAYLGSDDPASHAYRGMTPRNSVMFGAPGFSYIYFTYGFHHCFNVVTEAEGKAGAVLIRAVEPLSCIEVIKQRRKQKHVLNLTNGPGKLTQAFGMNREHSGMDLMQEGFCLQQDVDNDYLPIRVSKRIGIRSGTERPFRFAWEGNPFVSKG